MIVPNLLKTLQSILSSVILMVVYRGLKNMGNAIVPKKMRAPKAVSDCPNVRTCRRMIRNANRAISPGDTTHGLISLVAKSELDFFINGDLGTTMALHYN